MEQLTPEQEEDILEQLVKEMSKACKRFLERSPRTRGFCRLELDNSASELLDLLKYGNTTRHPNKKVKP